MSRRGWSIIGGVALIVLPVVLWATWNHGVRVGRESERARIEILLERAREAEIAERDVRRQAENIAKFQAALAAADREQTEQARLEYWTRKVIEHIDSITMPPRQPLPGDPAPHTAILDSRRLPDHADSWVFLIDPRSTHATNGAHIPSPCAIWIDKGELLPGPLREVDYVWLIGEPGEVARWHVNKSIAYAGDLQITKVEPSGVEGNMDITLFDRTNGNRWLLEIRDFEDGDYRRLP